MPQGSYGDKGILRVFLVGFMCSGKTTVGRILAEKTGWELLDIDSEIERREGMSIPLIFEKKGEDYFRDLELKVLKEVAERKRIIVATGGGLGSNSEAMDLMKSKGYVVWIEVSFEEFMRRCSGSGERPLLRLGERVLRELMEKRSEVYSRAHLRVSGEREPEKVAEDILINLSGYLS